MLLILANDSKVLQKSGSMRLSLATSASGELTNRKAEQTAPFRDEEN
jgi:hypothetical protein